MFENQNANIFQRDGVEINEDTELDALSKGNELGKENPTSSQEEQQLDEKDANTSEGKTGEEEDNLPFHKHPRFKQLVEERNSLREEIEDLRNQVGEVKENLNNKENNNGSSEIPTWFVEMFGDNEAAWRVWEKKEKADRDNILREALTLQEKQKELEEQEVQKWDQWVDDNVSAIPDIKNENDRNELLKIMLDYKPTDDQGNLDFQKGYNIWKLAKKPDTTIQEKKKIADISNSEPTPEKSNDKGFLTTNDIRGKAWYQI